MQYFNIRLKVGKTYDIIFSKTEGNLSFIFKILSYKSTTFITKSSK